MLVNWLVSALGVLVVAYIVPGVSVSGFGAALIAAVVIGLVSATLGLFLKIITFPLTIITLGLFLLVVNAIVLKVAAALVPGFRIVGFLPAFFGSIILSLVTWLLRFFFLPEG